MCDLGGCKFQNGYEVRKNSIGCYFIYKKGSNFSLPNQKLGYLGCQTACNDCMELNKGIVTEEKYIEFHGRR